MTAPTEPAVDPSAALDAVDRHLDEFVDRLRDLCRLRSRRQEPAGMAAAAQFVAEELRQWGGTADIVEWENSYPYVLGEIDGGPRRLLHFLHYDVEIEPTGDESAWTSPPYAAEIRQGRLFARGVADDKGALMSRIHAVAAWRLAGLTPPVTSIFLIEGKRRLDSPGLPSFVRRHADRLASDGTLWENSWSDALGRPLLKLGEKGLLYLTLSVRTLNRDLTSQNAALLPSASHRLVAALASLHHPDGRVRVPGFYTDVRPVTAQERQLLDQIEFDGEFLRRRSGVTGFVGGVDDREATSVVRTVPTLTIAGVETGDNRPDVTLGLPSQATAKVEIRLVAGQRPERILRSVEEHLREQGFADVRVEVVASNAPNATDHRDPFVALVADAARRAYGHEPVIEPYTTWVGNQAALGDRPIVGIGVSRADSGFDGPDENVRIDDYRSGIRHVVEIMAAMADGGARRPTDDEGALR
ncbi:M20/M25/M40 family metallo-hydrolase [Solwaraspora sp. WMMD406]|uniref:M20/M25/M40 family metallo-hydrolase n=1 Tax=Solwaraspora sp. WMMD406 TaxID=3016095 RepID=UPI002417F21B|nr:M20/M25/M40 family metallo-hydrolase [Solwaraspora sp. WMMD406]MDG4762541.1 M20/M25/M40 family metallo-hydrolase [Solwaraspora sp. WMMD406]